MATTGEPFGLFWDSESGDRTYSAASFEYWLKKFFTSGVFNGDLQVKASSGMTLEIEPGYANVDGKVKFWNGAFTLTLSAANSTYPRIDTIVITRDNVNRQILCEVVTGAYSGDTPQPTAPVRNSEIYQLVLAQIYVGAGVTGITQADITDTRTDVNLCGYITGTVEELDFSAFTAQFEAYFAEFKDDMESDYASWFNAVQQQQIQDKAAWDAWYAALQEELHNLPPDTAEYLQIEIDEIRQSGTTGSILKIVTTESTLEGKTVTVTCGTEVRTATFDSNLEAVISGFKGVGQVTITSTDGIDTATRMINIPYYGKYEVSLSFFMATVNIVGDSTMAYHPVIVKDSNDDVVGTIVLDEDAEGTFVAYDADTYTFSIVLSGTTYTTQVEVTSQTTYTTRFYYHVVVDLYSAANDTVSYTDADGAQTVVTDSSGKAENVEIKALFTNPTITFTSGVAKDLPNEDLTTAYSKEVTIGDNTAEIKVMPNGAIYWYGHYEKTMQAKAARGSNQTYITATAPTKTDNTNSVKLSMTSSNNVYRGGVYFETESIDLSQYEKCKAFLLTGTGTGGGGYGAGGGIAVTDRADNNYANLISPVQMINALSTATFNNVFGEGDLSAITSNGYVGIYCGCPASISMTISAIWLQ